MRPQILIVFVTIGIINVVNFDEPFVSIEVVPNPIVFIFKDNYLRCQLFNLELPRFRGRYSAWVSSGLLIIIFIV